jgi:hypothetical protein
VRQFYTNVHSKRVYVEVRSCRTVNVAEQRDVIMNNEASIDKLNRGSLLDDSTCVISCDENNVTELTAASSS